ncbi:MAG: YggS family pyridoxal phosphate-dependent enzyme [Clostridiaceae bacterium]|jgi:pyridoxal phosphate enzyme (YggS family)|nr:YggS family pyridoxal phosphate-dependent enzyme [Clostridiaceae bacterium]
MFDIDEITENIRAVRECIRAACESVLRDPSEVTLVLASKTVPKAVLERVYARFPDIIFGENRVQEFTEKYDARFRWHIIGQLQSNKVKYIAGKTELIHSLDRLSLAEEINRQALKNGAAENCLIEINLTEDPSRGGVKPVDAGELCERLKAFEGIKVSGLMAVMPNVSEEDTERHYERLSVLFAALKSKNPEIRVLSVGMSGDFEAAVKHGSTMVRVGSAVFGVRPPFNPPH